MPLIELTTVIQAPIRRCFDLARSIDLHKLSMTGTEEQAIDGITSGLIGQGERVTWRARHFGITQTLTSEITRLDLPYYFRDEMIKGAFKVLRHDHLFQETGKATLMTDRFYFESPGWLLGKLINKIVLTSYLKGLIEKRNQVIKEIAETDQWKLVLNPTIWNYQ